MLGKLLKYDLRSMLKQFAFIWPAVLAVSVINRFTFQFADHGETIPELVATVGMLVYAAIVIALLVLSIIFVIQRFFKGLLGDEGYLMFTLPVKSWQLVFSKLLCAMIATSISFLVAFITIFVIATPDFSSLRGLFSLLGSIDGRSLLFIVNLLVTLLLEMAQTFLMLYLSMAIGHLFNKNRIAMSVIAYVAIQVVLNILYTIFGSLLGAMLQRIVIINAVGDFLEGVLSDSATIFPWGTANVALLVSSLQILIISAICFFITNYILKRRLNLE